MNLQFHILTSLYTTPKSFNLSHLRPRLIKKSHEPVSQKGKHMDVCNIRQHIANCQIKVQSFSNLTIGIKSINLPR